LIVLVFSAFVAISNASLNDGLLLHYTFDETFSGVLANSGTGSFSGVPVGAVHSNDGFIQNAYEFDGIDDYIVMQPSPDLGVQDHTVSAWVRANDYAIGPQQIVFSTLSANHSDGGIQLNVAGNLAGYGFRTSAGESISINSGVIFSDSDDGQWHHVLATHMYESGTGQTTLKIYVDGSLKNTWADTRASSIGYANQVGYIGINYDSTAVGGRFIREFGGAIDEVRLYDRVLDSFEIQELATSTDAPLFQPEVEIGPAIYYLTQSTIDAIYELFGRNSPFANEWISIGKPIRGTGDIIYGFERGSGPTWLPSRAWNISDNTDGYSLLFDGTDDFAFRAHDPLLNLDSGMTLEAWIKREALGNDETIIAKAASPTIASYRLGMNATGHATFQVFESSGTPFVDLTGGITLTNNTWTHLAATYDGSTAKLLLNGVLDSSSSATGSVRISSLSPLGIGGILGSDTFGGLIDEVRLWDHARTEKDILANYARKLDGNEAGLVAYWQVQEPGSQMALDTTANGLDLTLGDTGNPESFDPTWFAESFPSASVFQQIFQFGTRWFSVFWETQSNETYTLRATSDLVSGPWTTLAQNVSGTGVEVEFFRTPPDNPTELANAEFYQVFIDFPLVSIDSVTVGDLGNTSDTNGFGEVTNSFQIGRHEVTNDEYAQFLNAVDPTGQNTLGLFNDEMGSDLRGGVSLTPSALPGSKYEAKPLMGNKPVNFVSFWDCCRFCNWLHNGALEGSDTEDGAYTLSAGAIAANSVTRNPGAKFFVPSEDEWYKAAYYDPGKLGTGGYWLYGTRNDNAPTVASVDGTGGITNDSPNIANYDRGADWNSLNGNLTTVGNGGPGSEGFYGAADMSGNVWEFTEGANGINRIRRGGSFVNSSMNLRSSAINSVAASHEGETGGFRVAGPADSVLNTNLTGGLIAYYPLDGNATDFSPNMNDGVVAGPVPVEDRLGNPNSAYCFDGANDLISIATLNGITNLGSNFTVAVWIKPLISGHWDGIMQLRGGASRVELEWKIANNVSFAIDPTPDPGLTKIASSSMTTGEWHHIAGTYDGTAIRIFVDGAPDGNKVASGDVVLPSDANYTIGYSGSGGIGFFHGCIDEFRMYDRVLSEGEIWQLRQLP
jgi:formylglycine-generating enzyme required for sulfatase activity